MKSIAMASGLGLAALTGLVVAGLVRTSHVVRQPVPSGSEQQANVALCDRMSSESNAALRTKLTDDQLDRLGIYLVKRYASADKTVPSSEEVAAATGITIPSQDIPEYGVAALLRIPEGRKLLDGASCARFQACSFSRILDNRRRVDVDLYTREKAEDGRTYENFHLPQFEGRDLSGKLVRSSDLAGAPVVLVLLALHCNHSVESLPILSRLAQQLKPEGRRVIGLLVSSGDVEDAKFWIPYHYPQYRGQYDVWVLRDASIGDAVGSHLTPTYLVVDKNGRVERKLVGFKTDNEVMAGLHTTAPERSSWSRFAEMAHEISRAMPELP